MRPFAAPVRYRAGAGIGPDRLKSAPARATEPGSAMSTETRSVSTHVTRFFHWWGGELASLVPSMLRPRPPAFRGIVLAVGSDGPQLIKAERRRISALAARSEQAPGDAAVLAQLSQIAAKRPRPPLAVRLPRAWVFSRRVALPIAAERDAARILALDLEQATPFRHRDVLLAHRIVPGQRNAARQDTIVVEQLICKRSTVDEALAPLNALGLTPDRVDCWEEDDASPSSALDIDFLGSAGLDAPPARSRLALPLAVSAVGLAGAVAWVSVVRLEAALADIESQTAGLRLQYQRAQAANRAVAAKVEQTAALTDLKAAEPSRAHVLEALTRLLPDTDHLTSFRIEGRMVEIAGYAASAAALVPRIEHADQFERVALTAPVTLDERSGRQRFGIRFEVSRSRPADPPAQPSKGG